MTPRRGGRGWWNVSFLAIALLTAIPAHAAPPVWTARSATAQVTLFGAVHLLPPGLKWRTPALDAELARADQVWFEASRGVSVGLSAEQAFLPDGQSLSQRLTPRGRERLRRVASGFGLWPEIDRSRPFWAEVVLNERHVERRGGSVGASVESAIEDAAPATAERQTFDTAGQLLTLFTDAPETEQVASLEETLRQIELDPAGYDRLIAAWARGDATAIAREAVTPLKAATPDAYERVVAARNRRWTGVIEGLLRGRGRVFVVVGVGHLVGPDSVPALLRRDGVAVEGP